MTESMTSQNTVAGRRPRVAILFGGRSSEHAVSCVTAAAVMGGIDTSKYDVIPIGITKSGQWVLVTGDVTKWSLSAEALPEVSPSEKTVTLSKAGGEHRLVVTAAVHDDGRFMEIPAPFLDF